MIKYELRYNPKR